MTVFYRTAEIELPGNSETLKVPIENVEECELHQQEPTENVQTRRPLRWVVPGIRVRVRNKQRTELYGQKVTVNDVLDQFSFTVLANGQIIDDLTEKDVQTLIPPVNSYVLILDQNCTGKLMSKTRSTVTCLLYTSPRPRDS